MTDLTTKKNNLPDSYPALLADIKNRIQNAQIKAALSANQEMIRLYWEIGENITLRQNEEGWGSQVTKRLSKDLMKAFPGMKGFSDANLRRMKAFYQAYEICAQAVRKFHKFDKKPSFFVDWRPKILSSQEKLLLSLCLAFL